MGILKGIKKAVWWLFLGLGTIFGWIWKYFLKWPALGIYKVWLDGKKIWQDGQPEVGERSLAGILFSRSNIHVLLILISGLVIVGNFSFQSEAQAAPSKGALFFKILGGENEDIVDENNLNLAYIQTPDGAAVSAGDWNNLPDEVLDELDTSGLVAEGGALIQPQIAPSGVIQRNRVETYLVQSGDTLAGIAERFGVSLNTLLWENGLTASSKLKTGQKLTILPVSGLTYTVKSGDNLQKIANTYKSNVASIIEANGLARADSIKAGQNLIIPGGVKPKPTTTYTPVSGTGRDDYYVTNDSGLAGQQAQARPASQYGSHRFPWGQCTWYVAQKRYVPWSGNANQWINNARALGYAIGNAPRAGAIIVTRESWWGHVAYVEAVSEKTVTFSESNYKGLGVITRRTLNIKDTRIIGYIY